MVNNASLILSISSIAHEDTEEGRSENRDSINQLGLG